MYCTGSVVTGGQQLWIRLFKKTYAKEHYLSSISGGGR
jgi:hypothetical protein